MRNEDQIFSTILAKAKEDPRIRAVILNGSRANKNITKDDFQDYDIIYIVNEFDSFKEDSNWIDDFGERIILQMPNSMKIDENDNESEKQEITYLMLFKDFNRIDLKLTPAKNKDQYQDSLSKILLDKDNLFENTIVPSDKDYLVIKPTQKEFSDCCNEFWWVTTYVAKGLARNEILYAKEMLEEPVRKMFMKMLSWHVGAQNNFKVNIGNSNRFLKNYLDKSLWDKIIKTYPLADKIKIWNSLLEMAEIFHSIGIKVASKIGVTYNLTEAENVKKYLKDREKRVLK